MSRGTCGGGCNAGDLQSELEWIKDDLQEQRKVIRAIAQHLAKRCTCGGNGVHPFLRAVNGDTSQLLPCATCSPLRNALTEPEE